MGNTGQRPLAENDLLDDIFATSPPGSRTLSPGASPQDAVGPDEPSDLPSLRRQHVTAGYRDGVFFARNQHVQSGFDAGFPVGAQLGIRVGTVLGILEGVIKGLDNKRGSSSSQSVEEQKTAGSLEGEQIRRLYTVATKELSLVSMFGGTDGNPAAGGDDKPEMQAKRKAEMIVAKWEKIVGVPKWEEIVDGKAVEQS